MLISHEVPIQLLSHSLNWNDYNYCLVHLCEQYPEYEEFYLRSSVNNKELLLDNSIFELGVAFDTKKFVGYVEKLHPTYYVIPDCLENKDATIQNFKSFVSEYGSLNGAKIGVVQGESFNDLVECYKFMSDNADYIALSFDLKFYQHLGNGNNKLERQCTGRQRLIDLLVNEGIINLQKPHHLLGCSLAKEFKLYKERCYNFIRSCDTSNPIVSGIQGLRYNGSFGLQVKPTTKLADLITHQVSEAELYRIEYNISKFREIVNQYDM